ncbi:MAG: protease modulator HflC [Myxococcota bacterium]|jgi:membrane protease subunit HflC|nr:protease modulator HflC [Myxococcota bacterium]
MGRVLLPLLLVMAIVVGLLWAAEYGYGPIVITKENEYKVIVGLTGPRKEIKEPGWDPTVWVIPFVDEVLTYDRRLRYLNAPPVRIVIANGEKLIIDYYALWRITDPLEFRRQFPNGEEQAAGRIREDIKSLVGSKIGALDLAQLLARNEVLRTLHEESSERLRGTGVEVVDLRLNRTEFPPNAVEAAYAQMREQQRALAREHRAQGERMAREMRASAERSARTTLATARAESENLRGAGDAEATRIFAEAHQQDPEFYAFVRSLEAYRTSLREGTTMVLTPDHPFLRNLAPELDVQKLPPVSAGR